MKTKEPRLDCPAMNRDPLFRREQQLALVNTPPSGLHVAAMQNGISWLVRVPAARFELARLFFQATGFEPVLSTGSSRRACVRSR